MPEPLLSPEAKNALDEIYAALVVLVKDFKNFEQFGPAEREVLEFALEDIGQIRRKHSE